MSWEDNLQTASFREIKFFVKSHSVSLGRRVISHEFPFADKPFTEDLGKKSRSFNIEGFLFGKDYFNERDKLIAACEQFGAGDLVHPYLGRLEVNCQSLSLAESLEEGGIANLSFQFVESGVDLPPIVETDKQSIVTDSSAILKKSTLDNFKKIYAVVDTVKSGIQKAKDALNQVLDELNKTQKLCADIAQTGNDLSYLVKEASKAIDKIIAYPDNVAALFETSYAALSSSIDGFHSKNDSKRMMAAASMIISVSGTMASPNTLSEASENIQKSTPAKDSKRIYAWTRLTKNKINQVQILNSTSQESNIEKDNKNILELTAQSLALSYLSDCAASSVFATSEDVQNTRNTILALSDEILENPLISDDMFSSIQSLQNAVCDALVSVENKLPVISIIQIKQNTNVLSFLDENFGSLEKEEDFISRNNISDPFFIRAEMNVRVAV